MSSRLARRGAAMAVASLLGVTGLAESATAAKPRPPATPSLAGTTIVKGSRTAVKRVALAAPAKVAIVNSFTAVGNGRFVGLVLRPAGAPAADQRAIVAGQINFCKTAGCTPNEPHSTVHGVGFEESTSGPLSWTLPAGQYDLYLVTDGAPATLTLKLSGVGGTSEITPDTAVPVQIASPKPTYTFATGLGSGPSLYSAGSAATIGAGGGMTFHAVTVDGTGPGDTEPGLCWYREGPPGDGNYHLCQGATHTQTIGSAHGPGPVHRVLYGLWGVPGGTWGLGGFVEALLPVADPHYFSVALSYVTAAAPRTTTTTTTTSRSRAGMTISSPLVVG